MMPPPDLSTLSEAEKDCLILNLWPMAERVQELMRLVEVLQARIAVLEAKLGEPPKTSDNSSQPPSSDRKADRPTRGERTGPRAGSVGRKGGGRSLCAEPDETVIATASVCAHCGAGLGAADQVLHGRYDKIDLPPVRPVVRRVERFAGQCPCCGGVTVAPVPEGLEEGSPFGLSILAVALYLRFAISYKRLVGLFAHLFALEISEGALDSLFRGARGRLDAEVAAILTRLRRARVIGSDETTVRVAGRTCWNWVFQNGEVVIHVIRPSRRRGRGGAGRPPAADLGVGPVQRPDRPRRRLADLPGPSIARSAVRHRRGRHGVRPAHEAPAAARRRLQPAPERP
jgi:transposase